MTDVRRSISYRYHLAARPPLVGTRRRPTVAAGAILQPKNSPCDLNPPGVAPLMNLSFIGPMQRLSPERTPPVRHGPLFASGFARQLRLHREGLQRVFFCAPASSELPIAGGIRLPHSIGHFHNRLPPPPLRQMYWSLAQWKNTRTTRRHLPCTDDNLLPLGVHHYGAVILQVGELEYLCIFQKVCKVIDKKLTRSR